MGSLTDYFNRDPYQPKYVIGDRVFGYYNKIPFLGTVGNDTDKIGLVPQVTVHLDLPIVVEDQARTVIIVRHKDIKSRLVAY